MARRQSYSPGELFRYALLKSSKMSFQINEAPGVLRNKGFATNLLREMQFLCESVELPGKSLATTEYRVAGDNRAKIPIARNFPEINLTFLHDEFKFPMYDFFSKWIELAAPREHSVAYYDDIVVKQGIELIQWEEGRNEASIVVQLRNAFPITLASLQGNWGDDNVQRVSVSFAFEDFKVVDGRGRLSITDSVFNKEIDSLFDSVSNKIDREFERASKKLDDRLSKDFTKYFKQYLDGDN